MNSSPRRIVLALALGALCTLAIAGCGGDSSPSSSGAGRLLDQTFKATSMSLRNGRVDAHLQLEPEGLLAIAGPLTLDLKGPFVRSRPRGLPAAKLAAVASVAGQRYSGAGLFDGKRAFLVLGGMAYRLDHARRRKQLASAKVDPRRWLKAVQTKGHEPIGATDTIHVTGTVDAVALLDDLRGLVPAQLRDLLAGAVRSADFDLWTGADDKILRQLALRVSFKVAKGAASPLPGLDGGTIKLRIRLDDVNNGKPPQIKAPAKALALSKLPTDRGLGGLVACLAGGKPKAADLAACVAALGP